MDDLNSLYDRFWEFAQKRFRPEIFRVEVVVFLIAVGICITMTMLYSYAFSRNDGHESLWVIVYIVMLAACNGFVALLCKKTHLRDSL